MDPNLESYYRISTKEAAPHGHLGQRGLHLLLRTTYDAAHRAVRGPGRVGIVAFLLLSIANGTLMLINSS